MTLKGSMVSSVHTTVTFQAFNGLEYGMVGARFFPRGGGARVPGTERHTRY